MVTVHINLIIESIIYVVTLYFIILNQFLLILQPLTTFLT